MLDWDSRRRIAEDITEAAGMTPISEAAEGCHSLEVSVP